MRLGKETKDWLLGLTPKDITATFMVDNFAKKTKKDANGKMVVIPSKYNSGDTIVLEKNEYYNKERIVTGVGLFIINKFLLEDSFLKHMGYYNNILNGDKIKAMEKEMGNLILNGKVDVEAFHVYLVRVEWIMLQFNSVLASSFSMNVVMPPPKAIKKKEELLKQHKEAIEKGDITTIVRIENEVMKIAKDELAGDYGMDLYDSGARSSFDGAFKPMYLMGGPTFNQNKGKYETVTSNLYNGINKEDIHIYGNSVVSGAYPKAIGTATSGHLSKQLTAAMQSAKLGGEFCGTKGYVEIFMTPWISKDCIGSVVYQGNSRIELTTDNISKYVNTSVKLYNPMYCISNDLCKTCGGKSFEKLGITNIGLTVSRLSSTMLNLNMKKFHITTAKIAKININDFSLGLKI